MNSTNSSPTTFLRRPEALASILALNAPETKLWQPEEMQDIWRHQLSAPIEGDLCTLPASLVAGFRTAPEHAPFLGNGFGNLLRDPHPPLQLLELTKDFAKQIIHESSDPQFVEVAKALYYASYAAGMARAGQRIGGLGDLELRRGFRWVLAQPWIDQPTKDLVSIAVESPAKILQPSPGSSAAAECNAAAD
jgi:hypothetical protein